MTPFSFPFISESKLLFKNFEKHVFVYFCSSIFFAQPNDMLVYVNTAMRLL